MKPELFWVLMGALFVAPGLMPNARWIAAIFCFAMSLFVVFKGI